MNSGLCTLQYAVGRIESCPGERCPFWDATDFEVGCVVAPIERHLLEQPVLAQHLLEVRAELDRARSDAEQEETRTLFYRLLAEPSGEVTPAA